MNWNLRRVSLSDTLTGTFNRRMFEKLGALEFSRARRNKEHFCFAILGVDDLDRINDTFGRDAGDTVLVAFGEGFAKISCAMRMCFSAWVVPSSAYCWAIRCPMLQSMR